MADRSARRRVLPALRLLIVGLLLATAGSAAAADFPAPVTAGPETGIANAESGRRPFAPTASLSTDPAEPASPELAQREQSASALKVMLTLSVFSLAPALLMMTTCFVRFAIVTALLKQALGTPNIPPQQVTVGLCMFLTFLVMQPVWQRAYDAGVEPYLHPAPHETPLSETEAFRRAMVPLRDFMGGQIEETHNQDAVWMFLEYHQARTPAGTASEPPPGNYQEVPLSVLLPAFLISELKTAFLIGFQIFLPFLVIDLVTSTVLTSMGLMMLPPAMVSLPFKLLLFVLIDGWYLIVGMLLQSVAPYTG